MLESDETLASSNSRKDRFGNPITTEIGKFSLANSKRSFKEIKDGPKRRNTSNTSGGTGEGQSSTGKPENARRHKISFMDEMCGEKSKLTEVHLIESYKKYNQEFFQETQAQGCCAIF